MAEAENDVDGTLSSRGYGTETPFEVRRTRDGTSFLVVAIVSIHSVSTLVDSVCGTEIQCYTLTSRVELFYKSISVCL